MKKNSKSVFSCQSCGVQSPKWMGRCPECGKWDTFVEESVTSRFSNHGGKHPSTLGLKPLPMDAIELASEERLQTGIKEFDRVLGGGIVAGSLILIGGDPGIGKSTLMLQALYGIGEKGGKVLYVSGEESMRQIKLRSERLKTISPNILVASEIDLDTIMAGSDAIKPDVIVIDSIQTMFNAELTSAPGSVSQVRESTMRLMVFAKKSGVPVFLVGHVTKDGAIAGPRIMEHMVDTVLYFEGDRNHVFRILRAVKNRFGSTNEIGVFEMKDQGLKEVSNPSAIFLSERSKSAPGSVVTASMEGTRPILVEIQGLASNTNFGTPRRTVLGLDQNRVALLVAVMEKKIGLNLLGHDIFMNVAGGVKIIEPSVDVGIVSAIASSYLNRSIPEGTVVMGEVGLTGEVRAISHVEARVGEIKKMGFSRVIIPENNLRQMTKMSGIEVTGIKTVSDAMEILF